MKQFINIDVININELKKQMEACIQKDWYFEITGERTKLLYDYITSLEESYKYLCDEYQTNREDQNGKQNRS